MTNWYKTTSSMAPTSEWDTTSSPTTAYQNNLNSVETIKVKDFDDAEYVQYTWLRRDYTIEEYNLLLSPTTQTIMQAISNLEISIIEMSV